MITIRIETNNAAFEEPGRSAEITRILQDLIRRASPSGDFNHNLTDINGNTIGEATDTENE